LSYFSRLYLQKFSKHPHYYPFLFSLFVNSKGCARWSRGAFVLRTIRYLLYYLARISRNSTPVAFSLTYRCFWYCKIEYFISPNHAPTTGKAAHKASSSRSACMHGFFISTPPILSSPSFYENHITLILFTLSSISIGIPGRTIQQPSWQA